MPEKPKILIIEDDSFLLQMYSAKLELEGYDVISVLDGSKGLKMALTQKPNLIILDLKLPELDGFQILKRIRKDNKTKRIPVIVLTNLSQKQDIDLCLNLGVNDYLIKAHFVPSEVIDRVKQILEK